MTQHIEFNRRNLSDFASVKGRFVGLFGGMSLLLYYCISQSVFLG